MVSRMLVLNCIDSAHPLFYSRFFEDVKLIVCSETVAWNKMAYQLRGSTILMGMSAKKFENQFYLPKAKNVATRVIYIFASEHLIYA